VRSSFARGVVWVAAIAGAIGLLLYLFVFDTWLVPETDPAFVASVAPNLGPGDRILLRRGSEPANGELARCADPTDNTKYVVGRVFGRTGDTVETRGDAVVVSGRGTPVAHGCPPVTLTHPVTGEPITLNCGVEENPAWSYGTLRSSTLTDGTHAGQVEPGKLFLVSDDRALHQDSRDFGQVDATTCEHIVYRLWGATYADGSRRFSILW
jgi:signal peptidase I